MTESAPKPPPHTVGFYVPGKPVGAARARVVRNKAGGVHAYTPSKTVHFEHMVTTLARDALAWTGEDCRITGPVEVVIVAYFPRPKSRRRALDPAGYLHHTSRPDADNIAKAVLDGLRHVMGDDSQVCCLSVRKCIATKHAPDEQRTSVTIRFGL